LFPTESSTEIDFNLPNSSRVAECVTHQSDPKYFQLQSSNSKMSGIVVFSPQKSDQVLDKLRAEGAKLTNDLQTLEFDLRKRKRQGDPEIGNLQAMIQQKELALDVKKLEIDIYTAANFPTDRNKAPEIQAMKRLLDVVKGERDLYLTPPDDKSDENSKKIAKEKAKRILKVAQLKFDLYNARKALEEKPGEESRKSDVAAVQTELKEAEKELTNEEKAMLSKLETQIIFSGSGSETNTRRLSRSFSFLGRREK